MKLDYETPEPKPQKNVARHILYSVGKAILILVLLWLVLILLIYLRFGSPS